VKKAATSAADRDDHRRRARIGITGFSPGAAIRGIIRGDRVAPLATAAGSRFFPIFSNPPATASFSQTHLFE
jgi:hypothetical protein